MVSHTPQKSATVAVLIGRFQPFHNGHLAMLQAALQLASQVIVVLGSAYQARTPKNPFTWQERMAMISASVSADQALRIHYLPMRDYYDETRWVAAVHTGVHNMVQEITSVETHIVLLGHFKDDSSRYLACFPDWQLHDLPRLGPCDATSIRTEYWNLASVPVRQVTQQLAAQVPEPVQQWLADWMQVPSTAPDYETMRQEWQALNTYHQAWASTPYPPVFVTVDALVLCAGHVLLVQRAHAPGKNQWALPGGFLEPNDTLWQSCVRELHEETALTLAEPMLQAALQGVEVFDHPARSQRGRTITHVHVMHLPNVDLPQVQGGDDARAACWVALPSLADMEARMFEDHFHVLRRCFERFGAGADIAFF